MGQNVVLELNNELLFAFEMKDLLSKISYTIITHFS